MGRNGLDVVQFQCLWRCCWKRRGIVGGDGKNQGVIREQRRLACRGAENLQLRDGLALVSLDDDDVGWGQRGEQRLDRGPRRSPCSR